MNILFVGDFLRDWNTGVHIAKSFEFLGHNVTRIHEHLATGDLILDEINSKHYDFILFSKHYSNIDRLDEIRSKIITIAWTLDLYFGLRRGAEVGILPFWNNHIVLSPDGGHDKEFRELKVNHLWMPPAVYHAECSIYDIEKENDIIFVGSVENYPAEWQYRRKLISWLKRTYGDRFKVFPQGKEIRGEALNKLYNSSKIVIGDCIYTPSYTSDRIYETIGRGGFIIYPRNTGLGLVENEHFVGYYYGDFDALKKKIDYYLEHEEEREKIRQAGYKYVLENHTYLNRCQKVIEIYNNEKNRIYSKGR